MASFPQFQPREYRRSLSNWWWLERRNYLTFILREFSSVDLTALHAFSALCEK